MVNRSFVCTFTLLFSVTAQAEIVEFKLAAENPAATFAKEFMIAPGKFAEACADLKKDQAIAWSFDGNSTLNFNVHYHVGKDVIYLENQKSVKDASATLRAPIAQTYCWMWSNPSTKDALRVNVLVTLRP